MRLLYAAILSVLVLSFGSQLARASTVSPARVLVVYNSKWTGDLDKDGVQDSLEVANYYAAQRGIPAANVLGVACTNDGGSGSYYYYVGEYGKFNSEMVQPIKSKLSALGSTNIDVIVLCYGIPSVVYLPNSSFTCIDNVLIGLNYFAADGTNVGWSTNPYFSATPGFGADTARFDHSFKFNGADMYLVARLDGPRGVAGVLDMIDQATYGQRYIAAGAGFYNGNAYVDSRYGQGGGGTLYTDAYLRTNASVISGDYFSYTSADLNMAYGEHYLLNSGLTLKWENTASAVSIGDAGAQYSDGTSGLTAPRALLYEGWYNFARYNDVWSWLPGSIACDLNSNSLQARSIRDANQATAFGCKAIERGATCFCGVIDEPYLNGHPRPNVMLYYVLKGYTFAEASILSTPSVAWMPINIGDPLYAPFAAKTAVKDTQSPTPVAGYPFISLGAGAGAGATDRVVNLLISDSPEPEMAQVTIDYGTTTAYGSTIKSGQGFWRRFALTLPSLLASTTYHYRITITDPVGNVTVLGDQSFSTNTAAPTMTSIAPTTASVGSTFTYNATATGSPTPLWSLTSAPAGMTVNRTTGVVTWTPTATGPFSVTLTAANGVAPTATQTWTINVVPNRAPVVSSAANAAPAQAAPNAAVAFTVVATDPDGDALTYAWDFGDAASATGSSVSHAYSAVGTYTATVTISDGHGHSISSSVNVTITTAGTNGDGGGGGGGSGSGSGGGAASSPLPFTLKTVRGAMSSTGGHDGSSIAGVIPGLPALFSVNGATVTINVGGATDTFTLNSKGIARNDHGSFALGLKLTRNKTSKTPFFAGGDAKFTATLTKGAWAGIWTNDGMNVNTSAKNTPLVLTITVKLNGQDYQIPANVLFSANKGRGTFKRH